MKSLEVLITILGVVIFFLQNSLVTGGGRFVKLENCTTTNRSLYLEQCEIVNDRFNMVQNIFKPLHTINVRNTFLFSLDKIKNRILVFSVQNKIFQA